MEPDLTVTKRKATDAVEALSPLQSTQKFAKSKLALAANDVIYTHSLVGFTRKARVITAHHNFHAGLERAHQSGHRLWHPAIAEDQVGHSDPVVSVHISGEGGQRAVGHADGDWWHVLEIVRMESRRTFITVCPASRACSRRDR